MPNTPVKSEQEAAGSRAKSRRPLASAFKLIARIGTLVMRQQAGDK
jgi:hypothetical protein